LLHAEQGLGDTLFACRYIPKVAALGAKVILEAQPPLKSGYTGSSPFFTHTASFSGGESMLGWAAGAGLDYKWQIDPGSAVILGVEYLHYQFDTNSITLPDSFGTGNAIGLNTKESVDTIKGRISWLFSIH
jgi:opacity protein-like surface antigen